MRRNRDRFTLMDGDKEGDSSEFDEERESGDRDPKKRCGLSRKEAIAVLVGVVICFVAAILFIVIAVATSVKQQAGIPSTSSTPWANVRLPNQTVPDHYQMHLRVDIPSLSVVGNSSIAITVKEPTPYIVIHAKNMSFSRNSVTQNGVELPVSRAFSYEQNDYFVIELSQSLSGPAQLDLSYNYTLSSDLAGFYNSSYVSPSGEKRTIACTQFEPTDARKAFPCFDEPAMKARFKISITHDSQLSAVSNMPSVKTEPDEKGQWTRTYFNTTVKMSTYLVAFVVSDFVETTTQTASGVQVSIWSQSSVSNQTKYALGVAKKVLEYYEKSFNIPYPLPKLDLFAIPDFAAGAMENWGLVTYRETALLYNPSSAPLSTRQWVATVVAHELAHQWFGNLVTMRWWDDLWLNEGFASFVEYKGADTADPSVNASEQFVVRDYQRALDLDSLLNSHPVEAVVNNPDEINSQFDDITYDKGSTLLRMLSGYMNYTVFLQGITKYLNQYKFGNAVTDQLWEAIGSFNKEAGDMMATWTKQAGYPLVTVETDGVLSQKRFYHVQPVNDSLIPESPYNYRWNIPITYVTQKCNCTTNAGVDTATVSWSIADGWIKLNPGQTAFMRVQYPKENWQKLTQHLKDDLGRTPLGPEDRAGLIDDVFALADSDQLDIAHAFDLSLYLTTEHHYVPWHTAVVWFNRIDVRLRYTPAFGDFRYYVSTLIEPAVQAILDKSTPMDSNLNVYLRSNLFSTAVQYLHDNVSTTLMNTFNLYYKQNTSVAPDLRKVVYSTGVAEGGEDEWTFLWQVYLSSRDPNEQTILLYALSKTRQLWLLQKYLQHSLAEVRSQDTLRVIQYVAENEHGLSLAWNFFRTHWDQLLARYGIGSFSMRRLIHTFGKAFTSNFRLEEFESFFSASDQIYGSRAVQQGHEYIRANLHWFKKVYSPATIWLAAYRKQGKH